MRSYLPLLLAVFLCASCSRAKPTPSANAGLSYEPAVVQLEGQLVIKDEFGPPNYGENRETDEKMRIPVLVLSQPANVRGDPTSDINSESFEGVKEVQLVFPTEKKIKYSHLIGKRVLATGTLFERHTAHHYTDVLLTVDSIREQ